MTRKSADLLVLNASELVTMRGPSRPRRGAEMSELSLVPEGALAVRGGRVLAVGTTSDIRAGFAQRRGRPLDASGKCVLPGLIDPHAHLVFAGTREHELAMKLQGKSYMEILKAGGGILSTVRATRAASERELLNGTLERLDRMLLHGTTTTEGKSGYGLDRDTELRSLMVMERAGRRHPVEVVPTFLGAHAVPPEYAESADEYIDFVTGKVLPEVARLRLARYCDVFCEEGAFTVEQSRRLLLAARGLGLGVRLHADEIAGTGGAELAAELRASSADHLLRASPEGLKGMAEAGVIGILLPGTPYSLMQKEFPDARKMVALGLPLALATDLNPNCMTESLPFIISLACYRMGLTPAEALTAVTANAAWALELADRVGTLEPGKQADIVVLDAPNHIHLAYRFGVNIVDAVVKKGKVVVRDGRRVR